MNYYELFDLPLAPVVDRKELTAKYFALQKKFHPDFFSNGLEADQEDALQQSAMVNKAYKTFQDSEATLEYFLREMKTIQPDEKYNLPPDFLMEMMELNEELADENEQEMLVKTNMLESALDESVAAIIGTYDAARTTPAELDQLKAYYYKKKYLKRILDRLAD